MNEQSVHVSQTEAHKFAQTGKNNICMRYFQQWLGWCEASGENLQVQDWIFFKKVAVQPLACSSDYILVSHLKQRCTEIGANLSPSAKSQP